VQGGKAAPFSLAFPPSGLFRLSAFEPSRPSALLLEGQNRTPSFGDPACNAGRQPHWGV